MEVRPGAPEEKARPGSVLLHPSRECYKIGIGKPNLKLLGLKNVQDHFGHRNTKFVHNLMMTTI